MTRIEALRKRLAAATPGLKFCLNCGLQLHPPRFELKKFCDERCKHNFKERKNKDAQRIRGERYRQSTHGREIIRRRARRQYEKDPAKAIARAMLHAAVKSGKIHRPTACEQCYLVGPVNGHHYAGYDRAHWYTVRWLCDRCHAGAHFEPRIIKPTLTETPILLTRPCSIPGCRNLNLARGYCSTHYTRWRKYGDPQAPDRRPWVLLDSPVGDEG